jgi:M6 family metalloprotease-like protein
MKKISALISWLFASALFLIPAPSAAAPTSDCRIAAAPFQTVSLGFPVAKERLKDNPKPKILILPFRLSDRPTFTFGEEVKADYRASAEQIFRMSNGNTKPEMIFHDVIDIPETVADMVTLRINQQQQWQRDESKSTWGFIRKIVAENDSKIDFTGINAVIFHGSSTSNDSWIAEAMMFSQNPFDQWFRPIDTDEGPILNASLLDKRQPINTITHEIIHLYGLTDLYGTNTGPGRLSMMASNEETLLSYERWVLGWIPDSNVQCIIEATEINQSKTSTRITIPNTTSEQVVVIKPAQSGHAYVIETMNFGPFKYLVFFTLKNEARPPIALHTPVLGATNSGLLVNSLSGVGSQLISPNYHLLVTDMTTSTITLDLIPKTQLESASALIATAEANRSRIQLEKSSVTEPKPVAKKKKTIICLKGKITKKVVAVKPKCPTGFKRK